MYAVVPAAGLGIRMGSGGVAPNKSKVFLPLCGDGASIIRLAVRSIVAADVCRGIVVLTRAGDEAEAEALLAEEALALDRIVRAGGKTRQESVALGLEAIGETAEFALVHDGARPLCPVEKIREVARAGMGSGAAMLALPVKPSLKEVDDSRLVTRTIRRENVWEAQTPQVFRLDLLRRAHEQAKFDGFTGTDESELVERIGVPVRIVPGDERNVKVTTPLDLRFAEILAESLFE